MVTKPLENLTFQQRERLNRLSSEVRFDKLSVSFSIEDRDPNGRKKSAFYSVTASRGTDAEIPQMFEQSHSIGFAPGDVKIVRNMLCKHVVAAVYEDCVKRGILKPMDAAVEARAILNSYDEALVKLLQVTEPGDTP